MRVSDIQASCSKVGYHPPDKLLSSGLSVDNTNHAIRWIVIYPVDGVIRLSNNPGLGLQEELQVARQMLISSRLQNYFGKPYCVKICGNQFSDTL